MMSKIYENSEFDEMDPNDPDFMYLCKLFNVNVQKLEVGERVVYQNVSSEHNNKNGNITGIRDDGKYSITFDDGKKLAASAKNLQIIKNNFL